MSLFYAKKSRRQFLVGSGKLALAVPLLPSLLSLEARAQVSVVPNRMAFFNFGHCLAGPKWINPSVATTPVGASGAKEALLSQLAAGAWGSPVSPTMSHAVFEKIRALGQMTVIRGLDNMIFQDGHGGHYLSNSSQRVDQYNPLPFPSIDTIMEASPTLYPISTPANIKKVVRLDNGDIQSSYKKVGSSIVEVPGYAGPVEMFKDLFSSLSAEPSAPIDTSLALKKNILNKVYQAYVDVRSNRKISSEDKGRLEEHMNLVNELERKISSSIVVSAGPSCTKPNSPTKNGSYIESNTLGLQLMAIAIKCGLSKVFVTDFAGHSIYDIPGLPTNISLHNGIFHNNEGTTYTDAQINDYYVIWKKWHMDLIAQNFLGLLDVQEPGSDRTYLDNMITAVLSEGGVDGAPGTHSNRDYQPILLGTMGGYLKGNRYTVLPTMTEQVYQHVFKYRLPYNTLLITLLEAMKIPASEYAQYNGGSGYGIYKAGQNGDVELPEYKKYFGSRYTLPISEIIKG